MAERVAALQKAAFATGSGDTAPMPVISRLDPLVDDQGVPCDLPVFLRPGDLRPLRSLDGWMNMAA